MKQAHVEIDALMKTLREELPPILTRRKAAEIAGMSAGTLANIDSSGQGPARIKVGSKCGYPRDNYLTWLRNRIAPVNCKDRA